jgi:exportin-5
VEVLVRYLEGMGLFLKYFPDAAGSVINKLFELLTSLPFEIKVPSTAPFHSYFQLYINFLTSKCYIFSL